MLKRVPKCEHSPSTMMASAVVKICRIKALSTACCSPLTSVSSQKCDFSDSSRERFNVGVLGAGRIGRMHINNILQNRKLALKWVVEDNEKMWPFVKDQLRLHDTPFFRPDKLLPLLEEKSLDGVFVFSSTPSHTHLSCLALEHGKAVFVEKPAGETVEDIKKCFLAADKYNKPFLTGFNRRFDPTMAEAYKKVMNGCVGKLQFLRFTTRDSPKPSYDFLKTCDTTGCNILSDLCVHDIDQLVWLTQAERPHNVFVTTHIHDAVMAKYGEADSIGMLIKYKSGIIASFDAFRESAYGYDIRMEIFGSQGKIVAHNPRETSVLLDSSDGGYLNRIHFSFPQRFAVSFQEELNHFVRCLEGDDKPLVTQEESLLVAEIVDKGLESFREKRPAYF